MVSASHFPRASNVPLIRTPLVGRIRESAELRRLLSLPDVPLLTLTGPGGIGKTRLALQAAADLRERYRDGVCFVPLAPLRDPALVTSTVAEALGLVERDERAPEARIQRHLQHKHMLLVLDNFEHVLPAALVVADLLNACPGLQVLATSRTPLRISSEHELAVPPLALPDRHLTPTITALAETDAVKLFVLRAAAVDPGFDLTEANADDVAEICLQLDGLPLAIELAAARTRLLSPAALRARLANRLMVLTDGPRDQPPRLRSMRDAIAWSYDLLGPDEKSLYRRLAVFTGGFTLEAVEAFAGTWQLSTLPEAAEAHAPDRSGLTERPVFDVLSSLVDANLVSSRAGDDGEPRFVMLETIREFGLELLAAHGEAEETNRRHAAWFLALAERTEPFLYGHRQLRWYLDLLEAEHNNLRAALAWLNDTGAHEEALRLATLLLRYWYTRGHLSEGRAWLERTLATTPDAPPALRAKALVGLSALSWPQDDRARARAAHAEALMLVEGTDDREGLAFARLGQAYMAFDDGDFALADQAAREGKALYLELGRPWDAAMITVCMCKTAHLHGDLQRAEALCAENIAVFSEIGDEFGIATTQFTLGMIRMDQADPLAALQLATDAAKRYQAIGEQLYLSPALEAVAMVLARLGEFEASARLLGAAKEQRERVGAPTFFLEVERREQTTASALAVLGQERFNAAWTAGATADLDDVLTELSRLSESVNSRVREPAAGSAGFRLSTREREVLRLVVEGHSNPEIAAALFISHKTVRNHVTNILDKLGVESRTAAATLALRQGIV